MYIAACCVSFVYVLDNYYYYEIFGYDRAQLCRALLSIAPLVALSVLFVFCRFSLGYFLGFGFYTMILGYVWLANFSLLDYNHSFGIISAQISLLALLAPALLLTSPIRQRVVLSEVVIERLLLLILLLATAVIAVGVSYNFRIVGLVDMYKFRLKLEFPATLRYAIGIFSSALLPYAFACYFLRGARWHAAAALLLLLLFYPIMLTKLALFAPFWLLFVALLARYFEPRVVVVLSLFFAVLPGIVLQWLAVHGFITGDRFIDYFGPINFRMIGVPSIVLDMYTDFFSKHSLTYFCQISYLKPFVGCPYRDPLDVVMHNNYPLGFANGSLFATEGVASVGLKWAPLSALACGLIIAVGNRASSSLPARFVLVSGGLLQQILLNVPLTTTMLTHGGGLLFLLWYITPRSIFEPGAATPHD
jgi:hypothetical protein